MRVCHDVWEASPLDAVLMNKAKFRAEQRGVVLHNLRTWNPGLGMIRKAEGQPNQGWMNSGNQPDNPAMLALLILKPQEGPQGKRSG